MGIRLPQLPPHLACGAFILDTGIGKRSLNVSPPGWFPPD